MTKKLVNVSDLYQAAVAANSETVSGALSTLLKEYSVSELLKALTPEIEWKENRSIQIEPYILIAKAFSKESESLNGRHATLLAKAVQRDEASLPAMVLLRILFPKQFIKQFAEPNGFTSEIRMRKLFKFPETSFKVDQYRLAIELVPEHSQSLVMAQLWSATPKAMQPKLFEVYCQLLEETLSVANASDLLWVYRVPELTAYVQNRLETLLVEYLANSRKHKVPARLKQLSAVIPLHAGRVAARTLWDCKEYAHLDRMLVKVRELALVEATLSSILLLVVKRETVPPHFQYLIDGLKEKNTFTLVATPASHVPVGGPAHEPLQGVRHEAAKVSDTKDAQ